MLEIVVKPWKQDTSKRLSFGLGLSNLVHILLMIDKRTTYWFSWTGQMSRSHLTLFNLVNTIQTDKFQLGLSNLAHIPLMTRGHPYQFSRSGQCHTLDVKPCNQDKENCFG